MNEKLLTLKEVANKLRISERSIYRYIKLKKLTAIKVGYWRISDDALTKFLKENLNTKTKVR